MAISLDALPPYLSNRNHPKTKYVPPTLFFGFEISGEDQFWEVIWPNLGGVHPRSVVGMDGNEIEIVVLDNNVNWMHPLPQEALDRVAMTLGYPPKVYISIEYPWWGIRSHYHYTSELSI